MDKQNLEKILRQLEQPKFRLKQIQKAIYQDGIFDWEKITTIPKDLREKLKEEIKILPFEVGKVLVGKDKRSFKALLELADGNLVETVLISPKPDEWSVCISTQAGCPLGCAFCATGQSGFKRNLTAEEIEGQVLFWRGIDKNPSLTLPFAKGENLKISNIIFMGMGEPFLNWENVSEAIKNLHDPELFNFGWRSLSVSTSGIPEGIAKMAQDFPQVNLALSLHFVDDKKRSQFMPINKKHSLADLQMALRDYFQKTRRKVFLEYIVFAGLNDGQKDMDNLIRFIKSIGGTALLHVNLIPYNVSSKLFRSASGDGMQKLKNYFLRNGVNTTIRKSLGAEIQAACGQLAGKALPDKL